MLGIEHRSHKGLNNLAENSHLPVRRRERRMMRFKSAGQCQRFVSTHGQIANLFQLHRKHLNAADHRQLRALASATPSPAPPGVRSRCRSKPEIQDKEMIASYVRLRRRHRREHPARSARSASVQPLALHAAWISAASSFSAERLPRVSAANGLVLSAMACLIGDYAYCSIYTL